jgi:hypothetical protein
MRMTPEQREEARQRNRYLKEIKPILIEQGTDTMPCPNCATGTLREVMREGITYVACVRGWSVWLWIL